MHALKTIVAALLVLLGGCGAFVGSLLAYDSASAWGRGRFWQMAEAETFLLPEGFEGAVTVAFGRPAATAAPREGVARLYDFRTDTIRYYRDASPEGGREPDFYYVDARGRRTHLARGARCGGTPPASGVYVCPPAQASYGVVTSTWTGAIGETWVITRHPKELPSLRSGR